MSLFVFLKQVSTDIWNGGGGKNTKKAEYTRKPRARQRGGQMEQASALLTTEQRKSSSWWNTKITRTKTRHNAEWVQNQKHKQEVKDGHGWTFNYVGYNNINTEIIKKIIYIYIFTKIFFFSPDPVHSLCSTCRSTYHTHQLKVL